MATPRIFISSTCYDLKHIRESIKYFVKNIGYEPVMSEEGDVYYNPTIHTHDACLNEVATCNLFVLIIGGKYGGVYKETLDSITNEEYRTAVHENIPVFTLIDSAVHSDHHLYTSNKTNKEIDRNKITYAASDNINIFKFIDEVRKNSVNNAIHPFKNFLDIESYLKKQWSGMMFNFLEEYKHNKRSKVTQNILDDLSLASKKTEELVKYIYSHLDNVNAEKIIDNVSVKAQAEMFFILVFRKFKTNKLTIKATCGFDVTWYEYLQSAAGFILEEIENPDVNVTDIVLFPPEYDGMGVMIKQIINDEVVYADEDELKTSFEALAKLPKSDSDKLLLEYID